MTTTSRSSPILCRSCGSEMNRHARKVVEPRTASERARTDHDLGGAVVDVRCCPRCGKTDARPAP